jgi:zinc transport system permease protein
MAFFSDAIGHSAFAGVAIGILLAMNPSLSMLILALLVGYVIMYMKRSSKLSTDTIIGVIFAGVVAFGLAIVSRDQNAAKSAQSFLFGDILTIDDHALFWLMLLMIAYLIFQYFSFNRMLCIAINPQLSAVHRIKTGWYQYIFAALLSATVIVAVRTAGVLLVTALLIVPAAAARNFAKDAAGMFWYTLLFSAFSGAAGLIISAQQWARTPAGATIVLVSCVIFCVSAVYASLRGGRTRDSEQ